MTEEAKSLPSDVKIDENKVNAYLKDPRNIENQAYIVSKINGDWRDKHSINNMKKIVDLALYQNADAYLIIGASHLPNVSNSFGRKYKGMGVKIDNQDDPAFNVFYN
jgi:hypothetical protein